MLGNCTDLPTHLHSTCPVVCFPTDHLFAFEVTSDRSRNTSTKQAWRSLPHRIVCLKDDEPELLPKGTQFSQSEEVVGDPSVLKISDAYISGVETEADYFNTTAKKRDSKET